MRLVAANENYRSFYQTTGGLVEATAQKVLTTAPLRRSGMTLPGWALANTTGSDCQVVVDEISDQAAMRRC